MLSYTILSFLMWWLYN